MRDESDVCSLPVLSTLLCSRGAVSRVKCTIRRGLLVPKVALGGSLSLLRLTRSAGLRLCPRTLRESARTSTVEPARLGRGAPAALRAPRPATAHTTDILSGSALGVRLERRLWRRRGSSCAKPLLVLMRVQLLAVVRTG